MSELWDRFARHNAVGDHIRNCIAERCVDSGIPLKMLLCDHRDLGTSEGMAEFKKYTESVRVVKGTSVGPTTMLYLEVRGQPHVAPALQSLKDFAAWA